VPPPRASAVIFDLDGTLVQTRGASWDVFRKISDEFGLGLTGPQEYFALFNGNIFASLETLCRDRADSEQVRKAFLARLREEYNPAMVPGMAGVIRRLAGHCTLAVMSSNAMEVLRRVLVANGIAYCFAHVFGGDTAPDKAAAIRAFLADTGIQYGRRCEVTYDETPAAVRPDPSTTVLVTDTAGDIRDALEAGIRAVGVAWGMHGSDELTAAGAEFVAIWPQELPGYLLGDGAAAPVGACAVPGRAVSAGAATGHGAAAGRRQEPGAAGGGCGAAAGRRVEPGGGCGAAAGECPCGCWASAAPGLTAPVAAALAAAATIRRDRRRRAVQAASSAAPGRGFGAPLRQGLARPPGQGAHGAELRDAVRRILRPVQGDDRAERQAGMTEWNGGRMTGWITR
jgi:phosphoglycolate phosphatase